MKIITDIQISELGISPLQCVQWVREAFLLKYRSQLPPKISRHPRGDDFINTMPCLLPEEYHTFGCKIVSRMSSMHPALKSNMLVVDSETGALKALMDADWITAWRTGAVAALAISTFQSRKASIYSFMGLGAVGMKALECTLALLGREGMKVRLLRYKDHAEKAIARFAPEFKQVEFEVVDTHEQLVEGADVIVSAITVAKEFIVSDTSLYKPGVLIVPIHTRGFQNCDTIFDKIFADDEGHVKGFQYFKEFRQFGELPAVLTGKITGRSNDQERIISYNIGLGLHDIYYAYNICKLL